MKKNLLFTSLALALAMGASLSSRGTSTATAATPTNEVALLFLGTTNQSGLPYAVFCLTNGTKANMACVPEAWEEFTTGGPRKRTSLINKSRATRDWIGLREELHPGEAFTFQVPPPTTNAPWRLTFRCQEQSPVVDPVMNTVRNLKRPHPAMGNIQQFSGQQYHVVSPPVAP